MNELDFDRELANLLARPMPEPDPAFVDRVTLAARLDRQLTIARRQSLRRALVECGTAVAVGAAFFLLSQMAGAESDGVILLGGPAMAGLVMLLLWGAVALPFSDRRSAVLAV